MRRGRKPGGLGKKFQSNEVVPDGAGQGDGIGHFRNVRGLGKSMVVFRLFEKLKYSNERSTIF